MIPPPVKKRLHLLFLILSGLLAAGIAFVVISPPISRPGASGPPREPAFSAPVVLILGPAPAGRGERASLREFSFGETIYATVLFEELPPGEHLLAYRWINPGGGVEETFRRRFYSPQGSYRGWSWLELRGEDWLPLPLGPLGPGRFLGSWRVEIDLDGAPAARAAFTVR